MGIKEWIKENKIFLGVMFIALAVRLYYFFLTQSQPLWWDEADYMNIAKSWAFGPGYTFGPVRPILFPLIVSIFLRIANTELLPRILMLFFSIASVIGIYYLGKETLNKKAGLAASFLFSTFYIGLFYAYRLLVDLPSMAFFIYSALFFYKYTKEKKPRFLYLCALLVGIGTLFKLSTAFILLPFLVYLFVTDWRFIKRKETWLAFSLFILILAPYVIWGYIHFGGFVLSQASSVVAPSNYISNTFSNLISYLSLFNIAAGLPLLVLSLLGILSIYKSILYFGEMRKGEQKLSGQFYLLLLFLLPLLLISFTINHTEDRYIITIFPVLYLMIGNVIENIHGLLKENDKVIGLIIIGIFLLSISAQQISYSDSVIKNKIDSYSGVKQAGLWLKNNSNMNDIVATKSQPQIRYYSGLRTIGLPANESAFHYNSSVKFFMISAFETHQQWQYDYPKNNNLTFLNGYFDSSGNPLLLIYKLK